MSILQKKCNVSSMPIATFVTFLLYPTCNFWYSKRSDNIANKRYLRTALQSESTKKGENDFASRNDFSS